jgi:hypothetical protein
LQTFHAQLEALPNQVSEIVKTAIEQNNREKVPLTREVLGKLDNRLGQLSVNAHIIKQVSHMTLRRLGPATEKIRCVFIVQSIPMWDSLAEVYQAMSRTSGFIRSSSRSTRASSAWPNTPARTTFTKA